MLGCLDRLDGNGDVQLMGSTAADNAFKRRHIAKVTALGDADVVKVGKGGIGRIKLEPMPGRVGTVNAHPGVRGVSPSQTGLARRRRGQ